MSLDKRVKKMQRKKLCTKPIKKEENLPDLPVQTLNDDCLIIIFKHLTIADRIKVERVSKLWRDLARQTWRETKNLTMNQKFLGMKPRGENHLYPKITKKIITQILMRCGKYLLKIDLSNILVCVLQLVSKYCPNIQSVICYKVSKYGIEHLSKNCKNVTELCMYALD